MNRKRSLLIHGLGLTLRRFPALLWAFLLNFSFAALATWPVSMAIGHVTDTSLASRSLHTGFNLAILLELTHKLFQGPGINLGIPANLILYLSTYFLLVPGTLLCYQTGAPARLSTLVQAGILHFWRFVRITLLTLIVFALILGPLFALQNKWSDHVDAHAVGRHAFIAEMLGYLVLALVFALLRLYFDLVEVYTVQLGLTLRSNGKPDRRVRKALLPAFRALRHNFLRSYETFLLLAVLGIAAVLLTARTSMHSLAQPRVWPMFLLAQTGLFLMLLTRFWQRGAETTLSLDNPIYREPEEREEEERPTRASFLPDTPPAPAIVPEPEHTHLTDPIPNPEPITPSLPGPDPGVYHPEPPPDHTPDPEKL
ncbi:hypothetical protein [Granulicella arctica]|uniref:Uncharacterized protein n=1 Tax=Granulicella arctica TaxID=940613 RepID=A0A7Y9THP3_9BACT|nr:hypothetical protein [Granulicella arctica]NYF81296.1 hypothetical protein [Granulicella arctica]